MAVIDRINRKGDKGKRVVVGPGELAGPIGDGRKGRFSTVTRITGPVDLYEVTDGAGANEGSYTVAIKPYSESGFRATHGGVGKIALVRQANGVNDATATPAVVAIKTPRDRETAVTIGPVAVGTSDRLYVIVERRDVSTLKYQLELDRVLDEITIGTQPSGASVTAPAAASFTVVATTNDGGTLSYQWRISTDGGTTYANVSNGGVYSGATTASLAISNSTGLDGRKYQVVVSSTGGAPNVTSSAATLTVA